MAAKNFTFQNLYPSKPGYVPGSGNDFFQDDPWAYEAPPGDNPVATPKNTTPQKGVAASPPASPAKTQKTGAFDYSMFGTWGGGAEESGSGGGYNWAHPETLNQTTQYKQPTGSVSMSSSRVIKPQDPMPTLGKAAPFKTPEKTDIEPVRRKEMGSSYRRLSQVVARALAGIGDEDVMGTQKRNVLEGFGNTLSEAQQGAYRVARSEGAREDALNMTEAQLNWQTGNQTRMANFNAALQDYFKQYTTTTTSAKKYTYDAPDIDETKDSRISSSSLGLNNDAQALNLGSLVNKYFLN